eukprot:4057302-Amphidinium_carterae.2
MRQVTSQLDVFRAEHVRVGQSVALRATPPQMIQSSAGSASELNLISEVRGEEKYFHLHAQFYEHQGRLQEQMIARVQQQASSHTQRVQEEAREFQNTLQDYAEVVISHRV